MEAVFGVIFRIPQDAVTDGINLATLHDCNGSAVGTQVAIVWWHYTHTRAASSYCYHRISGPHMASASAYSTETR